MKDSFAQTIKELKGNTTDFFKFLFELRKQDPSGKYTNNFLKGNVKPVLIDIVCSNTWQKGAGA